MYTLTQNNITYIVRIPTYPVNLVVDHFVIIKGQGTKIPERLFSNNKAEIFFNLGDKVTGINSWNGTSYILNQSVVSGVRSSFFDFVPPVNYFMVGMRFSLFGFSRLFQMPVGQFTDNHFSTEEVWGREMTTLLERLQEASRGEEQLFNMLNEWVCGRIATCSFQEIILWNRLEKNFYNTNLSVKELLDRYVGYSHKHAIHLIRNNSGLAPKYIQKIIRFNKALGLISSSSFQSWCQVAYLTGYADQSHFIREFKYFSGFTPDEYLQKKPMEYRRNEILSP